MITQYKSMIIYGSTGTGKSFILNRYLKGILAETDYKVVLLDPKSVEFHMYKDNERITYYNYKNLNSFADEMKDLFVNRSNDDTKLILMCDEYADIKHYKGATEVFKWLLKNRRELNVEVCLASQLKGVFNNKDYKDFVDIVMDLK